MKIKLQALALLFVALLPCFYFTFTYHNDLGFWKDTGWSSHPESGHLILFARPIGAVLLDLQTNLIRLFPWVSVLNAFRFISFLSLAGLGALLWNILRQTTNLNEQAIAFILTTTFIQPAWLLAIFWLTSFVPGVISYIFGVAASFLYLRSKGQWKSWDTFLAYGLLMGAVLTYPPGACSFFWIFVFVFAISGHKPVCKTQFSVYARGIGFFGLSCISALLIQKFGLKPLLCEGWTRCETWIAPDSREYSMQMVTDPLDKVKTLWGLVRLTGESWFSLFPGKSLWRFVPGILLMAAAFIPTVGPKVFTDWRTWLFCMAAGLGFLILLNLPNLATFGSVIMLRTSAPNTILIGIGAFKLGKLILPGRLQQNFGNALLLSLVALSFIAGSRFFSRYAEAWQLVEADPEVIQTCSSKGNNVQELMKIRVIAQFINTPSFKNLEGYDFNLPFYVPSYLPGICNLQHKF